MKRIFKLIVAVILSLILLSVLLVAILLGVDYFGFMPNGHYPCTHEITCGKME